ncbi:hypothetical protein ACOBQB_00780 [Streptomyces sp. G5(2025)]|uniref:hypothetical protein n=1 Tax=Streptomyces sp. G5(2025) TaxID=3406628 RepID=UPI003C19B8E5
MHDELAERQANITRLLLHHVHAPVTGTHFMRGVLPTSAPSAVIRVVVGDADAYTPDELIAYEIPLQWGEEPATAQDITAVLRTLVTGTHIYSSDHISQVMGMLLVRADPSALDVPGPTTDDRALVTLRCFAQPCTEEKPNPLLCGFCFLARDRLRLYLDADNTSKAPGFIAVDVRPSHATTALLASLPSLLDEEQYWTNADSDPHCTRVVDLTDW